LPSSNPHFGYLIAQKKMLEITKDFSARADIYWAHSQNSRE